MSFPSPPLGGKLPNSFLSLSGTHALPRLLPAAMPRDTKGLRDEPRNLDELIDLCLQACTQDTKLPMSDEREDRVTGAISSLVEDCLQGTELDLQYFGESGMPGEYPAPGDQPELSPVVWAKLNDYVRARQGRGITDVQVPGLAGLACVAAGLARLPDLGHVTVFVPERAPRAPQLTLDLRGLQPDHPDKLTICIRGDTTNLLVQAPHRALVHASGISNRASRSSQVAYFDSRTGASCGAARSLAGAVYSDAPPQFDQVIASGLNINGKAIRRDGEFALAGPPKPGEPLMCQSDAMIWIVAQHQKVLDGKPGDSSCGIHDMPAAASWFSASYTDQIAIEEYGLSLGAFTEAIYDRAGFGAMLAQEQRTLAPGEVRWYLHGSSRHAMALELSLQHPGGDSTEKPEYTVTLFEPNRSVIRNHMTASSPDQFAQAGIDSWLTPQEQLVFFPGDLAIGTLTRWIPPQDRKGKLEQGPPNGPRLYVAPENIGSADFLLSAMGGHAPACVTQSIAAILDTKGPEPERIERLRGEDLDGRTALYTAAMYVQPANVTAYVRGILCAPSDRLSAAGKVDLLHCQDPAIGGTFLWRLAEHPSDFWPEAVIHAYVYEIACSSLKLDDKLRLLAGRSEADTGDHENDTAPHRGLAPDTAASIALHHAPSRVVAMMCAIFEARRPWEETRALLSALDVHMGSLNRAVKDLMQELESSPHPIDAEELDYLCLWWGRLGESIHTL